MQRAGVATALRGGKETFEQSCERGEGVSKPVSGEGCKGPVSGT